MPFYCRPEFRPSDIHRTCSVCFLPELSTFSLCLTVLGTPFPPPLSTNERLSAAPQDAKGSVSEPLCPPAACAWGRQVLRLRSDLCS